MLVDLASDYQDMAAAYQGLGYLESGITEPLNRFAEKMLDFSALLKHAVSLVSPIDYHQLTNDRTPSQPSHSSSRLTIYSHTPRPIEQ
jgi:hypothetical protein